MYLYQHQLLPKDEVAISPDDRAYYFGDGIYEVFRVYNGVLFEPEGHYRRLEKSAREVRIPLPYGVDKLHSLLLELIGANRLQEGTVYMQISRGVAPRSHPFPQQAEPVVMAYCSEVSRTLKSMQGGIRAVTADDIRWLKCDLKTLNLLANVMAKQHALDQGADEVILHRNGTITECSASNFMMVKEGELFTHPANHLILHGITREVVLRLARQLDIRCHERAFSIEDLSSAEEAFITGTVTEITPVVTVDGKPVGRGEPGPVTRRLQQAFEQLIGIDQA
ncbi:D-amino-acid transaminase [Paenibacillus piri]|uniref:D-alanine aminotransferase n=1 Tax=Paenibacillus piri TaxID=2547395 RepID=A0A4R5KLC5_9BACL|nr:D-amino-acid transaminase [Paenibacillus piri]TDF95992.1 D-amino-acid transaminase [Paenibacillus piri]